MTEKICHKHGCENTKCKDKITCSRFVMDQKCCFYGEYFFKINALQPCNQNTELFHDFTHKDDDSK